MATTLPTMSTGVVAYFTDWTSGRYGPDAIPYDKVTHINYAFSLFDDQTWAPTITSGPILEQVVSRAHAKGAKVAVSIGGWTGSKYFSPMAASASHRASFISSTKAMVQQYGLDGIDLDWEYPGRTGMVCNVINKEQDALNFLTLLRELRDALGSDKFISLAVRVQPFDGPSGPLDNVRAYAEYLDFINIMAYDINGSWSSKTAPNAPLAASPEGGDPFSVLQSVQAWTSAGFPREKLVMGVPFYGRSLVTSQAPSANSMYTDFVKSVPQGDSDDAPWAEPCPGEVPVLSGQWKWKNLREQGILTSPTQAAGGWERHWDNQTQTPWLYNPSTHQFISYDDPQSLSAKVAAIKEQGLAGAMVWALNQDNGELIDTVARVRE
ncbi:glycoside hydrolase [Piptocephalis cylindrospora]|uniref:Glycoside hydrolase n=1 Tax=Piptocephalis cylindrospora TaxID=1907219 RepID=A0A4P9Y1B2_9FUNG|nr:glycoside hydrolase [Piptocephalis cylindrospora]|eukprot:RKP12302.1 glycoside hydrolase [Piptocephalis cylindrospora]